MLLKIIKLSEARRDVNYYEEKVPAYILPDVFLGSTGRKITTVSAWKKQRRPEVLELLYVFLPNNEKKPVPLFLLINNRDPSNIDPSRKVRSEFWPAEDVIALGYGIA